MRFGLALPHYGFSFSKDREPTFERVLEVAVKAESLGFDSVWVSDHLLYTFARYGEDHEPIACLEPLTALAGLAAETERVRLGTLVLCSPFRHPALLAKMAATIDRVSGGRLDLGVGAGWLEEEFTAFAIPFGSLADRFGALEETLVVLAALSSGEPVSLKHGGVTLNDARWVPPPVQEPLPVWVGGKGGPRLLGLAARYAAGWNAVWRMAPWEYATKVDDVRRACERVGREPGTFRRSLGLYGVIGDDEGAARRVFERGRAAFPGNAMRDETWGSWCADTLSGAPAQVLDRVLAFENLGVEELIWSPWVLPFALPEPEQLDVFAKQVIEPLRSAAGAS